MPEAIVLPGPLEQSLRNEERASEARCLVFAQELSRREAARRLGVREGKLRALLRR
jgi:DNA-binding transcriptional regulator LsrR (DeoR family)